MAGAVITFRWDMLIPLLLVLAEIAGFTLFMADLAMVLSSIGSLIHVTQNVLLGIRWLRLASRDGARLGRRRSGHLPGVRAHSEAAGQPGPLLGRASLSTPRGAYSGIGLLQFARTSEEPHPNQIMRRLNDVWATIG
ncbi:MAG: hypothetical protein ACRDNF_15845 [Streptosporangiaceae bacterium]